MKTKLSTFTKAFFEFKSKNIPMVVVTLTATRGSAPQDLGARMIVGADGLLYGTIGGGKIEAHCIEYAQNMIKNHTLITNETWNLQKDIGMTCGGEVSLLFENESKEHIWQIAIFGAGHVTQALAPILASLDCQVKIIDSRSEWLDKVFQSENIQVIHHENIASIVNDLNPKTFILSITMGHAHDIPVLELALQKDFPYVGVIGSKAKRNTIEKDLRKLGLADGRIEKLICPIGLPIGSNDPNEIAISITSQLLQLRDDFL